MRPLSGFRISLAAGATCLVLGLSLAVRQEADGATPYETAAPRSIARPHQPNGEHITTPPPGFTNFRMRYPDEVRDSVPAFATKDQVGVAEEVNDDINRRITWRETRIWSVELAPHAYGDCKAYALTKQHVLREKGVPDGAFRLAIVYAAKYRGLHMIAEMRTPDNTYVLDSLENDTHHKFYTLAAMPSSYSVVEYQDWARPELWIAPAQQLVAENSRAMRHLRERADLDPWVYDPRVLRGASASREPRK